MKMFRYFIDKCAVRVCLNLDGGGFCSISIASAEWCKYFYISVHMPGLFRIVQRWVLKCNPTFSILQIMIVVCLAFVSPICHSCAHAYLNKGAICFR